MYHCDPLGAFGNCQTRILGWSNPRVNWTDALVFRYTWERWQYIRSNIDGLVTTSGASGRAGEKPGSTGVMHGSASDNSGSADDKPGSTSDNSRSAGEMPGSTSHILGIDGNKPESTRKRR